MISVRKHIIYKQITFWRRVKGYAKENDVLNALINEAKVNGARFVTYMENNMKHHGVEENTKKEEIYEYLVKINQLRSVLDR